jgi:putative copper resistance protein D
VIEWAGPLARFVHDAAGCALLGLLVFRLAIDPRDRCHGGARQVDWSKAAVALTGAYLLAGMVVLAEQLAAVAGTPGALAVPAAWLHYALGTWFGHVWLVQQGTAAVLIMLLAWGDRSASRPRADLALWTALAALAVSSSALSGHGAGGGSALAVPIQAIHLLAAGSWFGGLPVLVVLVWRATRDRRECQHAIAALRRFSVLAGSAMLCLAATGLATAWLQIGGIPPLLGTPYGELLLLKLALLAIILAIAARVRWRLLPGLMRDPASPIVLTSLRSLLALELLLAVGVVGVASLLAGTTPAVDDQVVWPLPVRFAPAATWPLPGVWEQVAAGLAVALVGGAAGLASMRRGRARRWGALAATVVMFAGGLGVAAWPLTVQASRDTYRVASVPYDVTSIANGARLFGKYCIGCHGESGMGDGPTAPSLPRPPADLTGLHVRDHTMGDMFGWISHGIAAGGMPGFTDLLSEDERWDLVNFVHTLSIGYRARVLRDKIVARGPWTPAPDFAVATRSGPQLALRDYRGHEVVLLVLFTVPDSEPRLRALAEAAANLAAAGVAVIAVPIGEDARSDEEVPAILDGRISTAASGHDLVLSYMLFRRTLENLRGGETGPKPRHVEFLIDRYGYLRARWVPEDEAAGWRDMRALLAQAGALRREAPMRPPPDNHLH